MKLTYPNTHQIQPYGGSRTLKHQQFHYDDNDDNVEGGIGDDDDDDDDDKN